MILLSILVIISNFWVGAIRLTVDIIDDKQRVFRMVARGEKGGAWVFKERGNLRGKLSQNWNENEAILGWSSKFPNQINCRISDMDKILFLREFPSRNTIRLLRRLKLRAPFAYDLLCALIVHSHRRNQFGRLKPSELWVLHTMTKFPFAIKLLVLSHIRHFKGLQLAELLPDPTRQCRESEGYYQQKNRHGSYDTIESRIFKSTGFLKIVIA